MNVYLLLENAVLIVHAAFILWMIFGWGFTCCGGGNRGAPSDAPPLVSQIIVVRPVGQSVF